MQEGRKREAEHIPTDEEVWGGSGSSAMEQKEDFRDDGWEVERVPDCQMFPLSLLCVFDTPIEGRSDGGRWKG